MSGPARLTLGLDAPTGTAVQIGTVAVPLAGGRAPGALPPRPYGFVGRRRELAEIARAVRGPVRAVVVSGRPGGGITALAVEAAHRLAPLFPDGVLAEDVRDAPPGPAGLTGRLLAGLGLPVPAPQPGIGGPARRPRRARRRRGPGHRAAHECRLAQRCRGRTGRRLLMGACRTPTASLRALQAERAARPRDPAAAARTAARIALAALSDVEREVLDAALSTGLPLVDPARCAALLPDGPPVDPLLRALLRRGLLSRRPGPGAGPWCAVPKAVTEVVPAEEPSTVPAALPAVPAPRPAGVDLPTTRHPTDLAALLQRLARDAADRTDHPVAGIDALATLATARTHRDDDSALLDPAYAAALDLADLAGDPVLLGRAVHRFAAALAAGAALPGEAAHRGGLRDARTAFDLAVDLLTGRDDAAHAHALLDRAQLARRRNRAAEALADLHAAIALYRTLGRAVDVATAWQEVAAVERGAGHPCRAVAAHRSALAALVEAGDPAAAGWSRLAAGLVQVGELPDCPDLVAARLPDGPAARSVRELHELDPTAPDWLLVAALTSAWAASDPPQPPGSRDSACTPA